LHTWQPWYGLSCLSSVAAHVKGWEARFVLNSRESWSTEDGDFHSEKFFNNIVSLFDGRRWSRETLAWWNAYVVATVFFTFAHADSRQVFGSSTRTPWLRVWCRASGSATCCPRRVSWGVIPSSASSRLWGFSLLARCSRSFCSCCISWTRFSPPCFYSAECRLTLMFVTARSELINNYLLLILAIFSGIRYWHSCAYNGLHRLARQPRLAIWPFPAVSLQLPSHSGRDLPTTSPL